MNLSWNRIKYILKQHYCTSAFFFVRSEWLKHNHPKTCSSCIWFLDFLKMILLNPIFTSLTSFHIVAVPYQYWMCPSWAANNPYRPYSALTKVIRTVWIILTKPSEDVYIHVALCVAVRVCPSVFIVNWLLMGVECFAAKRISIWGCVWGKQNAGFLLFFIFPYAMQPGPVEGVFCRCYILYVQNHFTCRNRWWKWRVLFIRSRS